MTMQGFDSVSYTHLDVYKRQALQWLVTITFCFNSRGLAFGHSMEVKKFIRILSTANKTFFLAISSKGINPKSHIFPIPHFILDCLNCQTPLCYFCSSYAMFLPKKCLSTIVPVCEHGCCNSNSRPTVCGAVRLYDVRILLCFIVRFGKQSFTFTF